MSGGVPVPTEQMAALARNAALVVFVMPNGDVFCVLQELAPAQIATEQVVRALRRVAADVEASGLSGLLETPVVKCNCSTCMPDGDR